MKRQIRRGVFESNSSSTHAICITKNNDYKISDHVDFEFGEFGWEIDEYSSIHSKASYLITAIYDNSFNLVAERLEKIKGFLSNNNIKYTLPEPNKVESYEWNGFTHYYYDFDGYIDHAGKLELFLDEVLGSEDIFMRYLFGDSYILTGNDNDEDDLDLPNNDDYEIYEKWN